MKTFLLILTGIVVLAVASHVYFKEVNTKVAFSYLEKFPLDTYTNSYVIAAPKIYLGDKKAPKAVLLLHGFSASPAEFTNLTERLKQEGIPYYAPLLTGFGLGDFHLLNVVKDTDWERDAIFGYDILSTIAEKIDVIGHSNGGALAVLLAFRRPVNQIILSGPNLFVTEEDEFVKEVLETPGLSQIVSFLYPVFEKPTRAGRVTNTDTRNPTAAFDAFHFKALPLNSLITAWSTQNLSEECFENLKKQKLFLLFGENDETVEIQTLLTALKNNNVKFHQVSYKNSGHNIFEDYDSHQVVEDIIHIIK